MSNGEKPVRPRGTGSIFQKEGSKVWTIQYYKVHPVTGRKYRVRESTGTKSRSEALKILTERLSQINKQEPFEHRHVRGAVTVADLYKALKLWTRNHRGAGALKDLGYRWLHLEPFFGGMLAANVSSENLEKYKAARKQEGAANASINREIATLRHVWNRAKRATPPLVHGELFFEMLPESKPRQGFVEQADFTRMAAEANELFLRVFIELAFTYGWRKGELIGLRVKQVNLLNRTIRLDPGTTKNGEGREVTMTARVEELIRAAVEGKKPEDYVLTREGNAPIRSFRAAWENLCVRAGVGKFICSNAKCNEPCKVTARTCAKCGGKRDYQGLIVHDLRRSAAKAMRRYGLPESSIMQTGGWKTASVFRRYAIFSDSDQRTVAEAIEKGRARERERAETERPLVSAPTTKINPIKSDPMIQ